MQESQHKFACVLLEEALIFLQFMVEKFGNSGISESGKLSSLSIDYPIYNTPVVSPKLGG